MSDLKEFGPLKWVPKGKPERFKPPRGLQKPLLCDSASVETSRPDFQGKINLLRLELENLGYPVR